MGKSRACSFDIFALNDIIDVDKLSVLYQRSLTECDPNDPFNDWSKVIEEIITLYFDIIDRINNESYELQITDEINDYEGNYVVDDWEIVRFVSDVIDEIVSDVEFIDSDDYIFEDFILNDEWENEIVYISSDFYESDSPEIDFEDGSGENILEDSYEELNFDIVDFDGDLLFNISYEDFWEFVAIDE